MTTNRVLSFDKAFDSFIHLNIHYSSLDFAIRLHIWGPFALPSISENAGQSALCEKDLTVLAQAEINGRQIKNIVKAARLLARQQKQPLSRDDVDTVLSLKKNAYVERAVTKLE